MAESEFHRIVLVDVEGSSALTDREKPQVRADLYDLLASASQDSGVTWTEEDRGDGVFLLVRADVPLTRLVDGFTTRVDRALAARTVGDVRLRLRLVIAQGEVTRDGKGSSGGAVDLAFGMLDEPRLKAALRSDPRARMAWCVPDEIYRSAVLGSAVLNSADFRRLLMRTKSGEARTWVTVTGVAVQPDTRPEEPADDAVPPPPVPLVGQTVQRFDNSPIYGMVGGSVGRDATFGAPPRSER